MNEKTLLVLSDAVWGPGPKPVEDRWTHEVVAAAGGWNEKLGNFALADWESRIEMLITNLKRFTSLTVAHVLDRSKGGQLRHSYTVSSLALLGRSRASARLTDPWSADTVATAIAYMMREMRQEFDTILVIVREEAEFCEELENRLAVQTDSRSAVIGVGPLGVIERTVYQAIERVAPRGIHVGKLTLERTEDEPI